MVSKSNHLLQIAIIVIVWYLGLTYLPQIAGTCLDGDCLFTSGEIVISVAIPLAFFIVPIALEILLYHKSAKSALSDIGLTRFRWAGIRLAAIYLLPLLVFFPLLSAVTGAPLALRANWTWFVLSALLNNGLVEETMMRGYVFRHLRKGRTFWRGAALSTAYFAGYHLPLILTAGPLVGTISVIVSIPMGFLTAYVYERGGNTVWGPILLHVVYNALAFIVVFPDDIQPIASSLYLMLGIAVSTLMLVGIYRSGYGRSSPHTSSMSRAATA